MKIFLNLALKSLWHRRETVILSVVSLALSIFLILSVERLRKAAEEGFTQTISQTDLIVGARTGPTNLVLATVFNRGVFANNIKQTTYDHWRNHPSVDWTIPLALGDGHRGYRVVGTTEAFYNHYHYQGQHSLSLREGQWSRQTMDVVIGAEVARSLRYKLGQKVVIDHGVTHDVGMIHHEDHPFKVAGILDPTGTIIDQTLFVTLESLDTIHESATEHETVPQASSEEHHHGHDELTAFFLKLKNRVDILSLQREINNSTEEPLSAVIPSVVVNDLWQMLSSVETSLRILGLCILLVSLLSMISILLATLNERRREMSILRALGASPRQLAGLLVMESSLITLVSVATGVIVQFGVVVLVQGWLKDKYGLFIEAGALSTSEFAYLMVVVLLGCIVGILPALRVYRSTLKDGLIVK